jgi:hypothetical protein
MYFSFYFMMASVIVPLSALAYTPLLAFKSIQAARRQEFCALIRPRCDGVT